MIYEGCYYVFKRHAEESVLGIMQSVEGVRGRGEEGRRLVTYTRVNMMEHDVLGRF